MLTQKLFKLICRRVPLEEPDRKPDSDNPVSQDLAQSNFPFSTNQYYHRRKMNEAKPLRELPPGSAWNEAMRRAMAISIAGFFVPNLLANFGVIPQLHQSFQFMPGICGVVGVFSGSMAFFLGYFHHKLIQGAAAAIAGLILPYVSTWLWFRVAHPSASAGLLQLAGPAAIVAIGTYFALMQWHANLSNSTMDSLTEQVVADDYGEPTARWERVTIRICQIIGAVVILALIFGIFGRGR